MGVDLRGCRLPEHRDRPAPRQTVLLTGITRLADMIPACEHCHHDLHDGHRTLRLRDGRLIDEFGWVTVATAAA